MKKMQIWNLNVQIWNDHTNFAFITHQIDVPNAMVRSALALNTPNILAYGIHGILNEYIIILIILSLWSTIVLVFEFLGLGWILA